MAHNGFKITCPVCGTPNNKTNERCLKCNSYLLEGLQSGNITIDKKLVQRFRQLNKGPDIICPVCKSHNKAIAKNCAHCGAWLLDEYWKSSKANDGYSHKLPSRTKRAIPNSQETDRPVSQINWFGWLLLIFAFIYVVGKMLPT